MEQTRARSSGFQNYPFLTGEEFTEVCHRLDRRYCQATLGPVRRQWKLSVCSALNTSFAMGPEYSTYLQIVRPLDGELDDGDLSLHLDRLSVQGKGRDPEGMEMETEADKEMVATEEADEAALPRRSQVGAGYVTYEIHLHPTYQAPCLWFSLHELPVDEEAFNIDTVFRRLVPDQYKNGLRGSGAIGGISADHNPVTGVPSFFVHPCLLGDAMSNFDCSKENYLMVWFGLVGGCVGLWLPTAMALES
ncbi:hypothetical protein B0T26DRAFT_633875 [Lasiosphaeria miniovina]|uniref:Ubiquitin-like-conjugating enzyme ATG10 n=1 Tax=Lasiosphaeria miniovina TaxID=1954250 RepID=A0AA40EBQ9_9PEZI|nr:uncharacterized protein B0T26DRAFT_633875 [Lasiosphaeria miniovina]KAK0734135.1 hypothetical protein B0T26DRAFT_633875 [Lasiosphaeria miniovina]